MPSTSSDHLASGGAASAGGSDPALTYAVGDIHGCLDLLDELLGRIGQHAEGRPFRLICLGDYIDRGPDSAGVVARLRALQAASPDRVVCLLGNHEDMLLQAVARPERERLWLHNGGVEALRSFGVTRAADLPADVLAWVARCPRRFEDPRRCYVHAGLNPAVDRHSQRDEDLVWIRDEFLSVDRDFGRFVVHGHTPRIDGRPELKRYRVNLDTAAVYGGRLTAGVFGDDQDGPVGFLHAPG